MTAAMAGIGEQPSLAQQNPRFKTLLLRPPPNLRRATRDLFLTLFPFSLSLSLARIRTMEEGSSEAAVQDDGALSATSVGTTAVTTVVRKSVKRNHISLSGNHHNACNGGNHKNKRNPLCIEHHLLLLGKQQWHSKVRRPILFPPRSSVMDQQKVVQQHP
ncbi:hypothetical protein ZWY2020_016879 [Hordeum vulgare]|nr:hypothetical protein ZWY2020_016879 [Hordeum vulgare]